MGAFCAYITISGLTHYSYEFQSNEFVNALESVSLETLSTESGTKDFVVVGTTISRGEDLAVKGAVCFEYLFSFTISQSLVRPMCLRSSRWCRIRNLRLNGTTNYDYIVVTKPKVLSVLCVAWMVTWYRQLARRYVAGHMVSRLMFCH